jgi:hypothetical protein
MLRYFEDLSAENPESFEVRSLVRGIPHFQLIVTDRTVLVLQYLFSRGTADAPLQQFPAGSQLHRVYLEEFERLWQLNAAPLSQRSGGRPRRAHGFERSRR